MKTSVAWCVVVATTAALLFGGCPGDKPKLNDEEKKKQDAIKNY